MTHKLHIEKKYLAKIENWQKTIELRLCDEKRRNICQGDFIDLYERESGAFFWTVFVTTLHKYRSFKELLSSDLFAKCGFDGMTVDEAVQEMYRFYTKESEQKYGVVGIEFEVLMLVGCGGR